MDLRIRNVIRSECNSSGAFGSPGADIKCGEVAMYVSERLPVVSVLSVVVPYPCWLNFGSKPVLFG